MTDAPGAAPLPPGLAELLSASTTCNRSLLFDRGFAAYDAGWSVATGAKQEFLRGFSEAFTRPADFDHFVARRSQALSTLGARAVEAYTQTRLVTGLGLPSPTEAGLLLDRLTGCSYLPGSSVKGLLRAAARRVAKGELVDAERLAEGDAAYWEAHWQVVFGPDKREKTPAKGQVLFFDAFPTEWPSLDLDVLTPHYQPYYGDSHGDVPPADWHDPIPVAFLTVAAGTRFRFQFVDGGGASSGEAGGAPVAPDPLPALERLLLAALDWLGIGAKAGSGYGLFGPARPAEPVAVAPPVPRRRPSNGPTGRFPQDPAPPPKAPEPVRPPGETLWKGVTLELWQGTPTIFKGSQNASCGKTDLPSALLKKLKKRKSLQVDARVVKKGRGEWRIEAVTEAE
jgi:CRISPR-associated protein Cmr6